MTKLHKRNVFQRDSLAQWMANNGKVQCLPLNSTIRLGPKMLQVIQSVFPGKHDHLFSESKNDTEFHLVEFEPLTDWVYDAKSKEIQRSHTLFSHLASHIAEELIWLLQGEDESIIAATTNEQQ